MSTAKLTTELSGMQQYGTIPRSVIYATLEKMKCVHWPVLAEFTRMVSADQIHIAALST